MNVTDRQTDRQRDRQTERQTEFLYQYGACVSDELMHVLHVDVFSLYAAVKVMFAVAIFITYGIQFYVPIEILWPSVEDQLTHHLLITHGEYLLRYFFLFVTCEFSSVSLQFKTCQSVSQSVKI